MTHLIVSNTLTSKHRPNYQGLGPGYSWSSSLAAMYMYEEVAVRLWDRGVTEGDVKSLYRDCHKGPIPHIRNQIVSAIRFTHLSVQLNPTWITVIINLHCIFWLKILLELTFNTNTFCIGSSKNPPYHLLMSHSSFASLTGCFFLN